MQLSGARVRNLMAQVAPVRGGEWVHFHNTALDGGFGPLGGGYGTWIIHARFQVPRAGWYQYVLDPAPHAQVVSEATPLQGLAYAIQGDRKTDEGKPKSVNAAEAIVAYLDPGIAEIRVQLPIAGNGSGQPPVEPNWVPVAGPPAGAVVILTPRIVPSAVGGTAPGPAPTGAPGGTTPTGAGPLVTS